MARDLKGFLEKLEELKRAFIDHIEGIKSIKELDEVRIKFLGRKGELARVMKDLPALSKEDKPQGGKVANEIKNFINRLLEQKKEEIEVASKSGKVIDITLPGRGYLLGSVHPITITIHEICSIFSSLGFDVVTGPEIETDFYNFEALNIPKDHPARDMQDTLYISDNILLRTHTSPLQIRTMLKTTPPVAAIAPGKVYRRDSDLTHSPMFHQIEGFLVDKDVCMGDLRGTLTYFVKNIFSEDTKVRFRPSFFPFTEPSAEVDISCVICKGRGHINGNPCRVCKQTGWVEILGCGLIDPKVFEAVSYDPEKYSGFAFGLGVERVAMLKYGINDLRIFFENDIRFLNQFIDFPVY